MSGNYDFFKYTLPDGKLQTYVDNAVTILADIKRLYPRYYRQFISPSEVLTLSGVRAYDTYYDLGKEASRKDIDGLKHLLKQHDVLLLEEYFPVYPAPNEAHSYSLLHTKALHDIPHRYKHLPEPGWMQPNLNALEKDTDFFLWWAGWRDAMTLRDKWEEPVRQSLSRDPWTMHNITFGVLLGYPGEAICSLMQPKEPTELAKIRYADAFDGAQPVYQLQKEIADQPTIKTHEQLWSDILTGVYAVLEPQILN